MADDVAELQRLEEELAAMPESDRLWAVREFRSSVAIFEDNSKELLAFLDRSEAPSVSHDLFSLDNRAAFTEFQQELARLVHNFVAAAFTLRDHARVFFRERYAETDVLPEYEAEVKTRFGSNKLTRFVQDLRNLMLHTRLPSVTSKLSWSPENGSKHQQFWAKSDLLKFTRWSAEVQKFVEDGPDQINIGDVVREYVLTVTSFYEWVFTRLKAVHAGDEAAVATKQEEIQVVLRNLAALFER